MKMTRKSSSSSSMISTIAFVILAALSVETTGAFQSVQHSRSSIHHVGSLVHRRPSSSTFPIIGHSSSSSSSSTTRMNAFWEKAAEVTENTSVGNFAFWKKAAETTEKSGAGKTFRRNAKKEVVVAGKAAQKKAAGKLSAKAAKAGKAAAGAKAGKAAAVAAVAAASVTLPSWQVVSAACILPTCLGYWKREYGVSYAYGTSTAVVSALIFRAVGGAISLSGGVASMNGGLAALHAGALMFYGTRLNLFLLYREMFVQRTKAATENIEKRATQGETNRWVSRTPFILSCAYLYYGLCAPLFVTAQLGLVKPLARWADIALKVLVGTTWFGFLLGALGDFQKSITKAFKGESHLVTGGIYSLFRHPNYTGEQIAWTANCLAGLVGAVVEEGAVKKLSLVGYVVSSLLGMAGIDFVLANATNSLENRQRETYGKLPEYEKWMKRSWSGWKIESRTKEESHEEPHLEVNDTPEESGSGI